ncbi:MAG: Sapep family Mn(2+)-dependent dipeptidase [Oscillospiraceae bacterium]
MTDRELLEKIDDFIALNEEKIVADIARLVAVPSVLAPAAPGAPFGPAVRQALDVALDIAAGMGLDTCDGDGYVGWASLPGEERGHIATIAHVDVVPAGEGWSGDAFTMRERDGWLLGRGVSDDKGPAVLCLYAAKFFKELGVPLQYELRVLLGCNEESGMGDLPYYFEDNPQPLFCFSPDASFPLCNGEKGNFLGWYTSGPVQGTLLAFDTGDAPNVIAGNASCLLDADPAGLPAAERITITEENGHARLSASGISGHAAKPEGTLNAIGVLVGYLLDNHLCSESEIRFLELMRRLHDHSDGSGLGIACEDEVFGALTCNGGVVKLEDGRLGQSVDIRYPTSTTGDALVAALAAEGEKHGASFAAERIDAPFYIPPDAPPIQALLNAYSEVSGHEAKPFTMGGGTYARHFLRAVSYGPQDRHIPQPDFAGAEHGPNEGASLQALLTALKIYILGLWWLMQLDYPA